MRFHGILKANRVAVFLHRMSIISDSVTTYIMVVA